MPPLKVIVVPLIALILQTVWTLDQARQFFLLMVLLTIFFGKVILTNMQ